ncbi:winged helix-turn-helix domain-containing protein [Enterovibrio baiacu]|uniref:winged helix-turn-helix domain-containing protein n=1 Tax=Enterovibrio baiacu TaxID=2491023 RepID=UPI001F0BDC05|nr:helix-turn-helix domain-containing protein [Enterovibrio baiacu]
MTRIEGSESTDSKKQIILTLKQYQLLKCLYDAHPKTLTNDQIIENVWGSKHTSAESLPQLINRTRHAIEDDTKRILVNAPSVGYSLNFESPSVPVFSDAATEPKEDEERTLSPELPLNANPSTRLHKCWVGVFIVLGLLTVFNVWEAGRALYYKADFENVFHARPYPDMKTLENGKTIVIIDNHECIYEKNQLLLQCS